MIDSREATRIYLGMLEVHVILTNSDHMLEGDAEIQKAWDQMQTIIENMEQYILPPEEVVCEWIDRNETYLFNLSHKTRRESFEEWFEKTIKDLSPLPDGILEQVDMRQIAIDYARVWEEA